MTPCAVYWCSLLPVAGEQFCSIHLKYPLLRTERLAGVGVQGCEACDGSGDCERCEGDGEVECECTCGDLHFRECPDCKGSKRCRCVRG